MLLQDLLPPPMLNMGRTHPCQARRPSHSLISPGLAPTIQVRKLRLQEGSSWCQASPCVHSRVGSIWTPEAVYLQLPRSPSLPSMPPGWGTQRSAGPHRVQKLCNQRGFASFSMTFYLEQRRKACRQDVSSGRGPRHSGGEAKSCGRADRQPLSPKQVGLAFKSLTTTGHPALGSRCPHLPLLPGWGHPEAACARAAWGTPLELPYVQDSDFSAAATTQEPALDTGWGGGGGMSRAQTFRKKPQALHRSLPAWLYPEPPAPQICVYKQHQAPTASRASTLGPLGAARRNSGLDTTASLN